MEQSFNCFLLELPTNHAVGTCKPPVIAGFRVCGTCPISGPNPYPCQTAQSMATSCYIKVGWVTNLLPCMVKIWVCLYIYIERERARVHLFCLGHATLPPVLTQRSAVHIAAHLGLKNAISTVSFTCDQCDTTINLLILSVRSQTQTQRNYIFDNLPLGQVLALRSKL